MAEEPDSIVFVVDDDASFRDSLESLLRSVGQPSASYRSARAFLEAARPDLPACLVLDVRLPEQSGLELQRALAEQGAACR
jgi:FixJ family two-component response regulator